MTDEALIEELARILAHFAEKEDDASEGSYSWIAWAPEARAILPIMERTASNAAKAEREKLVAWLRDAIGDHFADAADEYLNVEAIVGGGE